MQLAALQPHFTRAMMMRERLRGAAQGMAELAIERVETAILVVARDRRILMVNPAADRLINAPGLHIAKSGRLYADVPAQLAALEAALKACANCRFDDRLSLAVRLTGPTGSGVVARLAPPPASTVHSGRAAAIVFLSREGRSELELKDLMVALYQLTPAEAALVKALASGLTQEAFAEEKRVKPATVKTQLLSVFAKTGTRRQSDLMRLVYSIAR